jgi:hypothetical protein
MVLSHIDGIEPSLCRGSDGIVIVHRYAAHSRARPMVGGVVNCTDYRYRRCMVVLFTQPGSYSGTSWKTNSMKFAVASDPSVPAAGARQLHSGALSASKRGNQVAFVSSACIKGLRLVTVQLPEKFSPIGPEFNRTSPLRSSKKFACSVFSEVVRAGLWRAVPCLWWKGMTRYS